jgi:hypothetical protein
MRAAVERLRSQLRSGSPAEPTDPGEGEADASESGD